MIKIKQFTHCLRHDLELDFKGRCGLCERFPAKGHTRDCPPVCQRSKECYTVRLVKNDLALKASVD